MKLWESMSNVESCSKLERREIIAEVLVDLRFEGMKRCGRMESYGVVEKSGRVGRRTTRRALRW